MSTSTRKYRDVPTSRFGKFSVMLDVVQAHSLEGYAECFKRIGTLLEKERAVVISHVTAKQSAEGYAVSVFLLCDVKESQ